MNQNIIANLLGPSVAVVALAAVGTMALVTHINQAVVDQAEMDAAAQGRAVEIAQYYTLLHMASAGKTEELRQMMSAKLASDLVLVSDLPPTLNAATRDCIHRVTRRVMAEEKMHPEIFLVADPQARASEMKLWATLDRPALLTQTGRADFSEK